MPVSWTTEQILALAPDAASAKAAGKLANLRSWSALGGSERAVWGECQGSGKDPYRTCIDLGEPAFQCSCPSRKFPCKHGLALFLLLANEAAAFAAMEPPAAVAAWLEKRAEKQAKPPAAAASVAKKAPDPKAQARRAAERARRVEEGLRDLEQWLCDLVRQGLATTHGRPFNFWEAQAARLVDAQAPGVARLVRQLAAAASSGAGEGWQERLLRGLAKLQLLIEAHKRLEQLPEATQADIRALVGWNPNQEELLQQDGAPDLWLVVGQRVEGEERLRVQRTWLVGLQSNRSALLLQFAFGSEPFAAQFLPGSVVDAELVYLPSATPLRVLVKRRGEIVEAAGAAALPARTVAAAAVDEAEGSTNQTSVAYATTTAALAAYGAALARNPWLELFPMWLAEVLPVIPASSQGERWQVRDADGRMLPLSGRFEFGWQLLATSGGHPLTLFGEWDGDNLLPLGVWSDGRFCRLDRE